MKFKENYKLYFLFILLNSQLVSGNLEKITLGILSTGNVINKFFIYRLKEENENSFTNTTENNKEEEK